MSVDPNTAREAERQQREREGRVLPPGSYTIELGVPDRWRRNMIYAPAPLIHLQHVRWLDIIRNGKRYSVVIISKWPGVRWFPRRGQLLTDRGADLIAIILAGLLALALCLFGL